jgi:uncharacterized Zn-finger protein
MNIPPAEGRIECPYCSRTYVLNKDALAHAGGH